MEIRSITENLHISSGPLVVGVLIADVVTTLVTSLRWMADNYVGRLDTKTISSRSVCLKYLGMTTPRYNYVPTNLLGGLDV
jgi:hypothetical protein